MYTITMPGFRIPSEVRRVEIGNDLLQIFKHEYWNGIETYFSVEIFNSDDGHTMMELFETLQEAQHCFQRTQASLMEHLNSRV